MTRRLTTAVVVAISVLVLAGAGARAEAHALLATSTPAAAALLDAPPPAVVLTFTETPDPSLTIVHVLDSRGAAVEKGKAHPLSGQRATVSVDVPRLEKGVYTVTWRTTSAVDGHTTGGSFSFGVGVAPTAGARTTGAPTTPRPSPLAVFGRWAFYVGVVTLVGAGASVVLVSRRLPAAPRWWPVAAFLASSLGIGAIALDQRAKANVSFSTLLSSSTGHKLLLQAGAVALVLACATIASVRPGRSTLLGASAAAGVAMLARAATGHAGASSHPVFAIGVQWIHLLAVGAWVGGFAWLIVGLRSAVAGERWSVALRFSRLAAWSLLIVAVSGTIRALDEVGAWSCLLHTSFGQALSVKLGLVALIVGLGAVNRLRHLSRPPADEGALRHVSRLVAREATLGAAVLLVTAILAGLAPSRSVAVAKRAAPHLTVIGHDYATSVAARLTVTPGVIGFNEFDLVLRDYDHRTPLDASVVSLQFQSVDRVDVPQSTISMRRAGAGLWRGEGTVLAFAGPWRLTAVVERSSGAVTVPLTVRVPSLPQRVTSVVTPGLPTIYTITTAGGQAVQGYIDPERPGDNEVHVTFIGADGTELPTSDATIEATPPGGRAASLTVRRLGPGHFVGDATLRAGRWTFAFRASAQDGAVISGTFSDKIAK